MKNKKLYITLFTISIIFLGIGGTFAYLTTSVTATNITQVKAGNLTMTIDGGGNENVNLFPSTCTSDYAIKKKIVASAINTSGGKVSFSIGMNIATLSDDFKRATMKYALTTTANSCTEGLISSGNFKDTTVGSDILLIKNDYDNIIQSSSTYTKTYYLYIWLDQIETENLSGSISVNMKGTSSNNPNLTTESSLPVEEPGTVYYEIKRNANTTAKIDFGQNSEATNTNGIYMTTNTDSGIPVYYYRGNVDNHLIFANFCWRIVRTTETGGVKLIYDGVPSDGQCNNTDDATTIGASAFNASTNSPAYVGYMYGAVYTFSYKASSSMTGSIVIGKDITYNASTNTYTLVDTYTIEDVSKWNSEYTVAASKYHYTCFTSSDSCEKVNYVYYNILGSDNAIYSFYFELSDGKNHLDILKEMLDNSTNENDSTAKKVVDTWYQSNMVDYTSQLEDTVFCNDRSYSIRGTGWDKEASNKGNAISLYFGASRRLYSYITPNINPTLVCKNINDKFTTSTDTGNGRLKYPVGLITADEISYAGGGSLSENEVTYYLRSGISGWTLSPSIFSMNAIDYLLGNVGNIHNTNVSSSLAIRPVISLKLGTAISSGSGTATEPYIVG